MTEKNAHPDITALADYEAGLLEGKGRQEIEAHVKVCPLCALELKRISRFREVEEDSALVEESDWRTASNEMERRFRGAVLPAAGPRPRRREREKARLRIPRWMTPLAAAAVLAVLFFGVEEAFDRMGKSPERPRFRSVTTGKDVITPLAPSGEIEGGVPKFSWKVERKFDYFSLEIFNPGLDSVFKSDKITKESCELPDSIKSVVSDGNIYIWNVKGHRSMDKALVSRNAWFRVNKGKEKQGGLE